MAYHEELVRNAKRAVSICGNDRNITAVFWVNVGAGEYRVALADASAVTSHDFKSVAGARRWADKRLAA